MAEISVASAYSLAATAEMAAEEIRSILASRVKGEISLLTVFATEVLAHDGIVDALSSRFPGVPIFGGSRQNNRRENAHSPVRRREQKQQRFKSPGSAQRFLNVHAAVYNLFNIDRHLTSRRTMKEFRGQAFRQWRELTAAD